MQQKSSRHFTPPQKTTPFFWGTSEISIKKYFQGAFLDSSLVQVEDASLTQPLSQERMRQHLPAAQQYTDLLVAAGHLDLDGFSMGFSEGDLGLDI